MERSTHSGALSARRREWTTGRWLACKRFNGRSAWKAPNKDVPLLPRRLFRPFWTLQTFWTLRTFRSLHSLAPLPPFFTSRALLICSILATPLGLVAVGLIPFSRRVALILILGFSRCGLFLVWLLILCENNPRRGLQGKHRRKNGGGRERARPENRCSRGSISLCVEYHIDPLF